MDYNFVFVFGLGVKQCPETNPQFSGHGLLKAGNAHWTIFC